MSASHPDSEASEASEAPRTAVLGVLGGIASGKSTVARLLAGEAGLVLSADEVAHEVLASPEGVAFLTERFGPDAVGPDGRPDRPALARIVFGSPDGESQGDGGPDALSDLEGWTHPRVRARILALLREARAAGIPRVVLDVPLLLENDTQHDLVRLCDALVFVDCPRATREARATETRGWPAGELARREALQMPLSQKRERADLVLPNTSGKQELEQCVADGLAQLGLT